MTCGINNFYQGSSSMGALFSLFFKPACRQKEHLSIFLVSNGVHRLLIEFCCSFELFEVPHFGCGAPQKKKIETSLICNAEMEKPKQIAISDKATLVFFVSSHFLVWVKTKFDTFQLLNYAVRSSFDVKIIQLEDCTRSEHGEVVETRSPQSRLKKSPLYSLPNKQTAK